MWSVWAENLVVGTAVQESRLTYLRQRGRGPALGIYQVEPLTHADLWINWLDHRPGFAAKARHFAVHGSGVHPKVDQVVWNLAYATVICRLHYYRARFDVPAADDVETLARIWKQHYNTPAGRGTADDFVENYGRHARQ